MAEDNASQSKNDIANERIEVSLGPEVGTKIFANFQELEAWLQKEKESWNDVWGNAAVPTQQRTEDRRWGAQLVNQCKSSQSQFWRNLEQTLETFKNAKRQGGLGGQVDVEQLVRSLKTNFRDAFELEHGIPSESRTGKFIEQLSKEEGPLTAIVAFGLLSGVSGLECRYDWAVMGTIAAYNYRKGLTSQLKAEDESLNQFHTEWVERFNAQRKLVEQECAKSRELVSKASSLLETQEEVSKALLKAANDDWDALKQTYDEKLALAAPVNYWRAKAKLHCQSAAGFGALIAVAMCLLLWKASLIVDWILTVPSGQPDPTKWHPEYYRIALAAAAGILGVWMLRLLVRLFLSSVHLATDARERVTMVQTYLAMLKRKDKPIDEKHRELVLKAIFRPAATGIVKDDGMPLTPIELITRPK